MDTQVEIFNTTNVGAQAKPEFSNSFLKAVQVLRKNVPLLFYACF